VGFDLVFHFDRAGGESDFLFEKRLRPRGIGNLISCLHHISFRYLVYR
jgi:hypothetical protein